MTPNKRLLKTQLDDSCSCMTFVGRPLSNFEMIPAGPLLSLWARGEHRKTEMAAGSVGVH